MWTYGDFLYEMVKSTASALIWALVGWLFLIARNWRLEEKLRRTFANHAITMCIEGIGITLTNPTRFEVVVREVKAKCDDRSFVMNYQGPKEDIDQRRYVTLPAHSEGTWLVPRGTYEFQKEDFKSIAVEFLYPTLFGSNKLLTVTGDKGLIEGFNRLRRRDEEEMPRLEEIIRARGR